MSNTLYPAETHSGTVTSFIPLTTIWTAPAGCSGSFRLDGPSLMAFDPGYGLDINTDVICDPPAMTTWWEQGLLGGGGAYKTEVSIGPLTCPDGYSTVASSVKDVSSTLAMCCPGGYYLEGGIPGQIQGDCLSDVSSGMTLTYGSTSYDDPSSWHIVTTTLASHSTVGAIAIEGWNINGPRAVTSTPAPHSTTASTTTTTSITNADATASTSTHVNASLNADTGTGTSTTGSASGSSGLSTGAKAGIGVGVGVGGIALIAFLIWFFYNRHRKEKNSPIPELPVPNSYTSTPPPPAMSQATEGASSAPSELPGARIPTELEG
ncbi:hypothetical protein N7474_002151 [Penicillium riverlandense]|uniref:uncharacterized protein n=1 Tax=Penicillium riverlandense TaxID=1903569 RepID=UPI0025475E51|nr:uncharacterized protein N7474_002151 [Penicillium riverlandense]KAJ5833840.1 hypothetical protein N7474_002151 [Penicillium riverlandense]